jgi:hypothetical protein
VTRQPDLVASGTYGVAQPFDRLEACLLGHGSAVVSIEFLDPYPALLTADSAGTPSHHHAPKRMAS